ncbi:hypothetical protein NMY22_g4207 [Coprinellus aureogranulatus]|nr:hypothetical protein NMY22_g4207 [Coprinellus aureogranulatus]
MASTRFSYPSDLDSDGGYDSDQYSDYGYGSDDTDSLADNLGYMSFVPSPRMQAPRSRQYSSATSGTSPGTQTGMCVVCETRPPYVNPRTGQSYPTCGLKCAAKLEQGVRALTARWGVASSSHSASFIGSNPAHHHKSAYRRNASTKPAKINCVICKTHTSYRGYVTCGLKCAEKLCKEGGDPAMCDYCHQKPRRASSNQCGTQCEDKAKVACLLCKCRPKNGVGYHLCGKSCKAIATKSTPLILEAPKGHKTYEMVEKKFQKAWHNGTPPTIKKIFKIIENDAFLQPYAAYKQLKGKECFRYHGTRRQCQLGVSTTQLCSATTCPVCNILKTSFSVALARPTGAFGAGVYSSSSSSMAYGYCGGAGGAFMLTKVVLGTVWDVQKSGHVKSPPAGYDSVVNDDNGPSNQTIVYKNEAIRPVFLIVF